MVTEHPFGIFKIGSVSSDPRKQAVSIRSDMRLASPTTGFSIQALLDPTGLCPMWQKPHIENKLGSIDNLFLIEQQTEFN